jgi:hypothetical protein
MACESIGATFLTIAPVPITGVLSLVSYHGCPPQKKCYVGIVNPRPEFGLGLAEPVIRVIIIAHTLFVFSRYTFGSGYSGWSGTSWGAPGAGDL